MAEEGKPEEVVATNPDLISLRVVDQNGGEVFFRTRRTTPLLKLMKAFSDRKGIPQNTVRFLYDGNRIPDDATAKSLDMEDNDVIDVLLQQTGGKL